jgi:hypothetical protein
MPDTKPKTSRKKLSKKKAKQPKKPKVKKVKKAKIGHIGKLAPININEEFHRFFESGCTINPIFEYADGLDPSLYLSKFPPCADYVESARFILDSCLKEYGSETRYLQIDGGELLTQQETVDYFDAYMRNLNLDGMVNVVFSENAIAPTAVTHNPKNRTAQVTVSLPISYRRWKISGVLHHEIGTHLIRTINERKQIWHSKRAKFELMSYTETEEGLASLNTQIEAAMDSNRKPYLWSAALHYYSSALAKSMSFVEIFNSLRKYVDDPIKRWKECVRVKRGLVDSSLPGGCCKDQMYLRGAAKILKHRHEIDFQKLYIGKLSLEDYFRPDIQEVMNTQELLYPTFLSNIPVYLSALDRIAELNNLS